MNSSPNIVGVVHAGRSVSFQFDDPNDYISKKIIESKAFYEQDVLDELSTLDIGEGLFIDAGANIGNHSLYFSAVLGRKVVAYEPAAAAFDQLVRNVYLNRVEGLVTMHKVALGSRDGAGRMNLVPANLGASNFIPDEQGDVIRSTIDSTLSNCSERIALIKIDVEGDELEVLKGAANVILKDFPLLIVEGQTNSAFGALREYLKSMDYVPVATRGITPTFFFLHRSKMDGVKESAVFRIGRDIDHSRRVLQAYVARIETRLRTTLTTADLQKTEGAFEGSAQRAVDAIEASSSAIEKYVRSVADEVRSSVDQAFSDTDRIARMNRETIEHQLRVLSDALHAKINSQDHPLPELVREVRDWVQAHADELLSAAEARRSELTELEKRLGGQFDEKANQQQLILESQGRMFRDLANAIRGEVDALETVVGDIVARLSLDIGTYRSDLSNQFSEFNEKLVAQDLSLDIIARQVSSEIKDSRKQISHLADDVALNVADLLKDDFDRQIVLLDRQEQRIRAAALSSDAILPTLDQEFRSFESRFASSLASSVTSIQAAIKAAEASRAELENSVTARERQLEEAKKEEERLQSEISRLLVAVHTERARAKYLSRRLNVLYTSGLRPFVGKIRRILSPLTFGLLKPYEAWENFEKRAENRVVREVQDFKKLHTNLLYRQARTSTRTDSAPLEVVGQPSARSMPSLASQVPARRRDPVRIGIASIEIRRTALSRVIDCLYEQADEFIIYLNDYSEIPSFLKKEKIRVIHGKGDVGDRGKFYDVDNFSGYMFTCDDDIEYPAYYVQHCIDAIERYGRKAVVGWHGSIFKKPFVDYYSSDSRRVFSFRSGRPEDLPVHVLGTGCSSFHTATFRVKYSDFLTPNMADVYFALLGQQQSVPFVVIKHDAAEALPLEIPDDKPIHRESMQKTGSRADTREIQNKCVKEWKEWRAELPELVHVRASHTIAYVGRVDAERWKKGGILKSSGLIIQALRGLGHRIIDIEISAGLDSILEQAKSAEIIWIYPGDPERPDFAAVEGLIEKSAASGKQIYVNLSYNLLKSRNTWIRNRIKAWAKLYQRRVKACVFTYAALNDPELSDIKENIICIPKSIDFSSDIKGDYPLTEGIFLGDLQKLLNHGLVDGPIEDWISALRKALPDVTLYGVRQYGGKVDRDLGLTVVPFVPGRAWEAWLASRRIVCCLTPHATYEMIPIEAGGLGIPAVYRPMPQSHSESISTAGIQVSTPSEFAAACAALYHDSTLWNMFSNAASLRAQSAHIRNIAASLHVQLTLGKLN